MAELADRQAAPAADAAALDAYTSASTAAGRGAAYEDAARAALFVVGDFATGPDVSCSIDDGTIVRAAASVLLGTATTDTPLTAQLRCVRRDFNRLRTLARKGNWTDDTPVPPEVFGPLWPEGVAPHWAAEPQKG